VLVFSEPFQFPSPPSPQEQIDRRLQDLDTFPGSRVIERGPTELGGYPAESALFIETVSGRPMEWNVVLTNGEGDDRYYRVTLMGPPPDFSAASATFEVILSTFSVTSGSV
jgi:hypothetical protein